MKAANRWLLAGLCSGLLCQAAVAAETSVAASRALHWRMVGPFRGGRTRAVTGIPGQPETFLIGAVNGGVWKTTDSGRTWNPLFDAAPTQSIGAIAVAPSDPRIIYLASGEGLQRPDLSVGNGIYRSVDGGIAWTHLSLNDAQQIPDLAMDPRDPDRLYAAVLGHPFGPSSQRGIFRSVDGGKNWTRVLYMLEARSIRAQLKDLTSRGAGSLAGRIQSLDLHIGELLESADDGDAPHRGLESLNGDFAKLYTQITGADAAPTTVQVAETDLALGEWQGLEVRWQHLRDDEVAGLNRVLEKVPLPRLRRDLEPPRDLDFADED